jgi:predicted nucleic acid-binding protein
VAWLRAVVDTSSLVRAALSADSAAGRLIVVPEHRVEVCRDPADNMVLEAALASGNDVIIISEDRDLLILDPWRDIRIVKPEAALAMYEERQPANHNRGVQP